MLISNLIIFWSDRTILDNYAVFFDTIEIVIKIDGFGEWLLFIKRTLMIMIR